MNLSTPEDKEWLTTPPKRGILAAEYSAQHEATFSISVAVLDRH